MAISDWTDRESDDGVAGVGNAAPGPRQGLPAAEGSASGEKPEPGLNELIETRWQGEAGSGKVKLVLESLFRPAAEEDASAPAEAPLAISGATDAAATFDAPQEAPAPPPLTLTVTTAADELDAADTALATANLNDLSLREALAIADAEGLAGTEIVFDTTAMGTGFIRLTLGELTAGVGLTIEGGGAVTISGDAGADDILQGASGLTDAAASAGAGLLGDNSRIFNLTDAANPSHLSGLTLTGGRATGDNANGLDNTYSGGAVYAAGDLTIASSVLTGNSTSGDFAKGGGVFAGGALTLIGSTVDANLTEGQAGYGGGAAGLGIFTLDTSTVSGNATTGTASVGGGIFSYGALHTLRSTISGNSTGEFAYGGGIYAASTADITNTTISGNWTSGLVSRGGGISAAGLLRLVNATVSGNYTSGFGASGAGVFGATFVNLYNSTVTGNATGGAAAGGAGVVSTYVAFVNSIVLGNVAQGGGLQEVAGYTYFFGNNIIGADISGFDTTGLTGVINADPAAVFASTALVSADTDGDGIGDTATATLAGVLSDNGGPVQTVLILNDPSNPALDGGDDASVPFDLADLDGDGSTADDLPLDARDASRISGSAIDLGAYELPQPGGLDDILVGTSAGETLRGFGGNDSIRGLAGDDRLIGDAGDDTLDGGTGNDTLEGRAGNDLLIVSEAGIGGDRHDGGDGIDTIDWSALTLSGHIFNLAAGTASDGVNLQLMLRLENLTGSQGGDDIRGSDDANTLDGQAGDDFLKGFLGADSLSGGDGLDTLDGGAGDDTLSGGEGDDRLIGGQGSDILDGGDGLDFLRGDQQDDTLTGGAGDDRLLGNGGSDSISGGADNDVLDGGGDASADTLDGGDGIDRIFGRDGDDVIISGTGNDKLRGDGGADRFVFAAGDGVDDIIDWENNVDIIDLSGHSAFNDLADVLAVARQVGSRVFIGDAGDPDIIVLRNALVGDLDAGDFAFV